MPRSIERVGIIGAGAAGDLHVRALRRVPGVRIVAIRDRDAERAAALAGRFGLPRSVAEPSAFYAANPQVVHLATTPDAHQDLALEALQRGAHVLVEKPPALTVAGCSALLREADARNLTVGVNENTACDPLIEKGRAVIEAGTLGRLLHIEGFFSFGLPQGARPPAWMDRLPGGMLEDLLPHLLTTARALAGGRLTPRHWHLAASGMTADRRADEMRLLLAGRDGLTVGLALSLAARPPAFTLTVRGTLAALAIDLRNKVFSLSRGASPSVAGRAKELTGSALGTVFQAAANGIGVVTGFSERFGSFLPLIRAHYSALRQGTELPAPLRRGVETVGIARAIWPIS